MVDRYGSVAGRATQIPEPTDLPNWERGGSEPLGQGALWIIEQLAGDLDRWGWVQGKFRSGDGFCLVGLIEDLTAVCLRSETQLERLARSESATAWEVHQALSALADAVSSRSDTARYSNALIELVRTIVRYNDAPSTTYADISEILVEARLALFAASVEDATQEMSALHVALSDREGHN